MSNNQIERFVEAFSNSVGEAISGKASAKWTVAIDQKPTPFPAATQLVTMQLVAEPSQAEAAIQISLENVRSLATSLGSAAAPSGELQPGPEQTVRAAIAGACEKAAAVLEGTQVQVRVVKAINWTPAMQFSLTGTDGASGKIKIQLLFTADWPLATSTTADVAAAETEKGFDVSLLENVEIDVTLQFGERRLPLREIGELKSGSVVELDKYVQDPAELLLGDRVVARGEVVIVDGNYGLRITEVV